MRAQGSRAVGAIGCERGQFTNGLCGAKGQEIAGRISVFQVQAAQLASRSTARGKFSRLPAVAMVRASTAGAICRVLAQAI